MIMSGGEGLGLGYRGLVGAFLFEDLGLVLHHRRRLFRRFGHDRLAAQEREYKTTDHPDATHERTLLIDWRQAQTVDTAAD